MMTQNKPNSLLLADKTLAANALDQVRFNKAGNELLAKIVKGKMNDELAFEIRQYVIACRVQVHMMYDRRKELTDQLVAIRNQFVDMENSINPKNAKSPAFECNKLLVAYMKKKVEDFDKKKVAVDQQYERERKKLANMAFVSKEERQRRMERLEEKNAVKRRDLSLRAMDIELIPHATMAAGYVEFFKFWWLRSGQFMSAEQLDKIFHPMLAFAKVQARKGVLVEAKGVEYERVPKMRRA